MDVFYENIEELNKKAMESIDHFWSYNCLMLSNKKPNPIVTELSIRGRKLNHFLIFITQSYFLAPKDIE